MKHAKPRPTQSPRAGFSQFGGGGCCFPFELCVDVFFSNAHRTGTRVSGGPQSIKSIASHSAMLRPSVEPPPPPTTTRNNNSNNSNGNECTVHTSFLCKTVFDVAMDAKLMASLAGPVELAPCARGCGSAIWTKENEPCQSPSLPAIWSSHGRD